MCCRNPPGGMPPVTQVAQQISQEENQQQNGPNLSSLQNSLPAPRSRKAALPQQVQPAGWDKKHVFVVPVPVPSRQQHADCFLFSGIGMENQITFYEAQILPRLKVAIKLIEDIYCSPSSPRLEPGKLKSNSTSEVPKDPLQELILTVKQQWIALKDVITRDLCIFPAEALASPCLYVANPPYIYTHGMKLSKINLKEQKLPYFHSMQQIAGPHFLQFPDP